jgi:P4 family phage/plasmid primase-like protien
MVGCKVIPVSYHRMLKSKLSDFLNGTGRETDTDKKRYGRVSKGENTTHNGMSGGAWSIPDDDIPEFYKLYCDYLRDNGPLHMTEKSTKIGAMRIDLDFIYAGEKEEHLHTQEQVVDFTKAYMGEVKKFLKIPDAVEIFVSEKPRPTYYRDKDRSKSGLHLVIPTLKTNRFVEEAIRMNLISRMPDFFPDLPLADEWRKVYDPSPLTHTNNWTLLGSKKKEGTPYQIKYILDWDPETGDMSIDNDVPLMTTPDLLKKMTVRSAPSEETAMTEWATDFLKNRLQNAEDNRMSGGAHPARGRQIARSEVMSRGSSPDNTAYRQSLTSDTLEYLTRHVFNLASTRYTEYKDWIDVGICLKNIHPELESVFLEFSKQDPRANDREITAKWNSFSWRSDGARLELRNLLKWSKMDNFNRYEEIEKSNIGRLVKEAAEAGTEHDVAQVVYAMFRDNFKCAQYGSNKWYRFDGNKWCQTDHGVALLKLLSEDVRKQFREGEKAMIIQSENAGTCICEGKEVNPNCELCKLEREKMKYINMQTKLKTVKFTENVMKMSRLLFLDEEFGQKLDENKNLIAFANGVFDTTSMEFRQGRPDDCISFSTKVFYDPEREYSTYECWAEIDKFLHDVQPDPTVRNYLVRQLCTCLRGGNDAQKFHILTGDGSNGKSMLTNLMGITMGDYAVKVPISLLTQGRAKSSAAAPEVMHMKGKRFATTQEPDEAVPLNTGLMKELASCEKMAYRGLYKDITEFEMQAKMYLSCNEKPKVGATDGGTWRRLCVVHWPSKFLANPTEAHHKPLDESIQQKVMSEEWATCFLAYLVAVYREGNGWRRLMPPESVLAYTNEYQEDSDVIARFIREFITIIPERERSEDNRTTTGQIYGVFQQWKRTNEITKGSTAELKKRLEAVHGSHPRNGWTSFRCENA